MDEYKYRPLDPEAHQIRLLQIQKSSDESAPITVTLEHASLDDKPPFNALSYTWGDETPTTQIAIRDGMTQGFVSVRRNLFEFLKDARQSTKAWSSEWIWIDQISINQDDPDERGHQVGQMRKLYSVTRATLVWPWSWSNNSLDAAEIPPAEPEVDLDELIFDTPHYRANVSEFHKCYPNDSNPNNDQYGDRNDDISGESLTNYLTHWHYMQIIETPYWRRLWIIQEVVLAPCYSIVLSGRLWGSGYFINMLHKDFDPGFLTLSGLQNLRAECKLVARLHSFNSYRQREHSKMKGKLEKFSWDQVLYLSQDSSCTKPLDRVYGVMGFIVTARHILPDYNISEVELLRRLLSKVISTTPSYGRWWAIYKILLVWRFSEDQCIGAPWDLSLADYKYEVLSNSNHQRDSLDRHSRRKIRRVVRLALTELGIDPPRFISPLQDVIGDPDGCWDYLRDKYHLRGNDVSLWYDSWLLRMHMRRQYDKFLDLFAHA